MDKRLRVNEQEKMTGILGKKIGMTQIFSEAGEIIGVTAIEAGPCPVLAIRDRHVQLGFEPIDAKRANKSTQGYFKKLKDIAPQKFIREVSKEPDKEYKIGDVLRVDLFQSGDYVDITGISKGKGFQGGMKRWNWHGGPMTHGSMSHRRIGSMGSSATPSRVWKGQHLPGHMGSRRTTIQNVRVAKVVPESNLILVRGSVPCGKNGYLIIKKAKKKTKK
jgi:large subunit ribosomal protein L3